MRSLAHIFGFCFLWVVSLVGIANAADAPAAPVGLYAHYRENGSLAAWIRVSQLEDKSLIGVMEKVYPDGDVQPTETCTKCTGELKDQKMIGLKIMKDIRWDGSEWTGGTIVDASSGSVYNLSIAPQADGTLNLRGYIGISLFGRTTTWKPVKE